MKYVPGFRIRVLAIALCLCAIVPVGKAEPLSLADPTQPPAGLGSGANAVEEAASRLTSVILPKKGRPAAVIDGQVVALGAMVGEMRLVRVSESEAVLEGPEGTERLYLTPGVEKKMNVTRPVGRRTKE